MNLYWRILRIVFTIKRKIRMLFNSEKRKERKMRGMPVYFEDTGEFVGRVKKLIWNASGEVIGYEIEDDAKQILYFPSDAFQKTRRGLIFAPLWYSEGLKLVSELEAKAKMPDLHDFIARHVGKEELYKIVEERHPSIKNYVEDVLMLKEALIERLNDLEIRKMKLRKELMELSGKRLLKEIGRREFAEAVIGARREMNIIEIGIRRCKELLMRIEKIPFLPSKIEHKEIQSIKRLIENIPVNIVILDKDGVIKGGNDFIKKNFGYSIEEIKGKNFVEFVAKADKEKFLAGMDESNELEFEFIDKYGIHHKLYGRIVTMKGLNIMSFYRAEEQEALQKIFSEKIAHLFFNPLSIAQGYVYLLSEERYGKLTEEQKKQIDAVRKSLERIEKLLKETIKLTT